MQEESADLCSPSKRMERLRLATQGTWAEVAANLGLSDSMLYQVRSGKRSLSEKALFRLAKAEIKAGIMPPLFAKIQSLSDRENSDPDDVLGLLLEDMMKGEKRSVDDDAQLAALIGSDLLGSSLLIKWDFLNRLLEHFTKGVKQSISAQRRIFKLASKKEADPAAPGGLWDSIDLVKDYADTLEKLLPDIERQIDTFQFGLERLIDGLKADAESTD